MRNAFLALVFSWMCASCDFSSQLHKEILTAQNHITQKKFDQAVLCYEDILKKNPPRPIQIKIFYQLGELYSVYLGDKAKAITYFQQVIDSSSEPIWLLKSQEKIAEINFVFLRDYPAAIHNYSKLVAFSPKLEKHDFYEYRLAHSYLLSNELVKSFNLFQTMAANNNHEHQLDSLFQMGMISFQKKEWNNATDYWKSYLKKERNSENIVKTKFLIANTYETQEKLKEAYELYYSILGEYPNTQVIKNRLKSLYGRRIARKR